VHLPLLEGYGDEVVAAAFSESASVERWLAFERALATAQAELGVIPGRAAAAITAEATADKVDLVALRERTRAVGYPILPLLEQIGAACSGPVARYIHWGATTQDVMDTGLAMALRDILTRAEELESTLGKALAPLADEHRRTVMPGRTHARPAVPIAFGGKVAIWLDELTRHLERLREARRRAAVVQLFGAAGTAAALGEHGAEVRSSVAARLGLQVTEVPWHTARDRVAEAGFVLAAAAATCGKIAREVIELSRPELGELTAEHESHHGASSTMPQKQNPIDSEVVVGLSVLAAQQVPALLAAAQPGHERAAGEWHVEWDALPLVAGYSAGAVAGTTGVVRALRVVPERMRANLELEGGTVMAEALMMAAASTLGRQRAHDLLYAASVRARDAGISLGAAVAEDEELARAVGPLDEVLDPAAYLGETDAVVTAALDRWAATR
jgi:3-carboxy-cis,cis-muconate cycloisomerase